MSFSYLGGEVNRLSDRNLMALFFCAETSAAVCAGFAGVAEEEEEVMMSAAFLKSISLSFFH